MKVSPGTTCGWMYPFSSVLHVDDPAPTDDYEILADFFKIFNAYSSQMTGWPLHKVVKTKKGGTKRWRMSYEKHQVWFHKNFVRTDLMRLNLRRWDYEDRAINEVSYEEYYKDFFKSEFGFTHAVRKDFAIKVLTLGFVG